MESQAHKLCDDISCGTLEVYATDCYLDVKKRRSADPQILVSDRSRRDEPVYLETVSQDLF